jgi:hypothetical protein
LVYYIALRLFTRADVSREIPRDLHPPHTAAPVAVPEMDE